MTRPFTFLLAVPAAAFLASACGSPTSVAADFGSVVALASLRTVDATAVPCCTVDSAGARVSIVAGTLTFRRYSHYTDTVATPGGLMSAACVTEVPNGAVMHANGLVTEGDTVAYLAIPCHVGTYALALTERVENAGGGSRTLDVAVSSGTYSWRRDTLFLVDVLDGAMPATLSADTIAIAAPGHDFRLLAVPVR